MTRREIVENVASKTGFSHRDLDLAFCEFISEIKKSVAKGEPVTLRGFGTFQTKTRKAKKARNISKGEEIILPETVVPHFKPAREFKDKVANSKK